MHKLSLSIFCLLIAFACCAFAQDAADSSTVQTMDQTPAEKTASSGTPAKQLSKAQVVRILDSSLNPYPKYLPAGVYLRSSYGPSDGVDIGIGFSFPLFKSWPVALGFEPFHLEIAADDFQVVSDETLWIAAAGAVIGALGPVINGSDSKEDSTAKAAEKKPMSTAGKVLATIALVPVYAICGNLYVPIVPGAWLGILDQSHLVTQLISEGFSKKSFTYMNDVGLRLSPLASSDGVVHGYLDGGIRFKKNFDADLKYHYFAELGVSLFFR